MKFLQEKAGHPLCFCCQCPAHSIFSGSCRPDPVGRQDPAGRQNPVGRQILWTGKILWAGKILTDSTPLTCEVLLPGRGGGRASGARANARCPYVECGRRLQRYAFHSCSRPRRTPGLRRQCPGRASPSGPSPQRPSAAAGSVLTLGPATSPAPAARPSVSPHGCRLRTVAFFGASAWSLPAVPGQTRKHCACLCLSHLEPLTVAAWLQLSIARGIQMPNDRKGRCGLNQRQLPLP
eukprot:351669-Chlamydomonas_euryale.AAC.3